MSDLLTHENNVTISEMMAFENGEASQEEIISMFQRLINSGLAWRLQGFYGRTAARLIGQGHCTERSDNK